MKCKIDSGHERSLRLEIESRGYVHCDENGECKKSCFSPYTYYHWRCRFHRLEIHCPITWNNILSKCIVNQFLDCSSSTTAKNRKTATTQPKLPSKKWSNVSIQWLISLYSYWMMLYVCLAKLYGYTWIWWCSVCKRTNSSGAKWLSFIRDWSNKNGVHSVTKYRVVPSDSN